MPQLTLTSTLTPDPDATGVLLRISQVLHPLAMQPCIKAGVHFRVKNSYNPLAPGTPTTKSSTRMHEPSPNRDAEPGPQR